jgi:hypothetical protein
MCIGNFGTINDECANAMEGLLWKQEPEFQHLRSNVGSFTDESKNNTSSHSLAYHAIYSLERPDK